MFKGFVVIITSLFFIPLLSQAQPCKLLITAEKTIIDGRSDASSVKPGDTICLLSGDKLFLWISHLHGTKEAPIVICNKDGIVSISGFHYGLKIDSCSNLKLTGFNQENPKYGIQVHDVKGAGISIEGLSTDIEIEGIEVSKTILVGLFAKSDPNCQFNSVRGKYILRNLSIHDNYFHQIGMEALYIGSSFYEGQTIQCNEKDTTVLPHLLRGVNIFNNIIENSGWDGIQVSSSDSGCAIHDNFIQNDSDSAYWNQMSGIMMGGGSTCDCFNNTIKNGNGDGIDIYSLGGQKIFNNLIVNAGRTFYPDQNYYPYLKHGIYVGNGMTKPDEGYSIFYNTIISPKSNGIKFANLASKNNLISNNIIIDPGLFSSEGNKSFIMITDSSIDITINNNFLNKDFSVIGFIDSSGNFDLKPLSPAVNTGTLIEGFQLLFDILNRNRPFSKGPDIGAYECHDSTLLSVQETFNSTLLVETITPNPFFNNLKIIFTCKKEFLVTIEIVGANRHKVFFSNNLISHPGRNEYQIDTSDLEPGFYICRILTSDSLLIKKLIHIR